jgi:hypothetical protein
MGGRRLAAAVNIGAPLERVALRNKATAKLVALGRRSRTVQILPRRLDAIDDLAEYVADGGTKYRQNDNDNDGDENQNQRVLYKTLAFPLQFLEHGIFLLSLRMGECAFSISFVRLSSYIMKSISVNRK